MFTSTRLRAVLGLGVALGIGTTGTFAFWTDDVVISGTTFSAGTLDLKVNNSDDPATTTLSMSNMAPGASSAEVLTIKNNGNVPFKYTMTGNLSGTDAALYSSSAALNLTIRLGGAKSGTANASTCTGGAQIYSGALTNTAGSQILTKRPTSALAQNATEALCFQVTFNDNAPTGLQGRTTAATFTAQATSDLS
jgi:predicted ribosomally synthesized peptide with SipW-like signal peptide